MSSRVLDSGQLRHFAEVIDAIKNLTNMVASAAHDAKHPKFRLKAVPAQNPKHSSQGAVATQEPNFRRILQSLHGVFLSSVLSFLACSGPGTEKACAADALGLIGSFVRLGR